MAGITHLREMQKPALRGLVDAMENEKLEVPSFADEFLPKENVYSTQFAYDIIKKSNQIGAMIGVGAEPPVMDRDAVASRMGEMAKFGLKYIATEEELLQLNQPRSSAEKDALIEKLVTKGADVVKGVQDRIDVTKAEAISLGQVSYNKNGVKVSVDFTKDMPKNHKINLTNKSSDWSNVDHDVIGDLLTWTQDYEDNSGQSPKAIMLSREVQALLLKNTVIVTEAAGAGSGRTRVSVDELNSVLGGYGLPPVRVISKRKVSVKNLYTGKDEVIEFFPVNRVIMASDGLGKFLMGPTVENDYQPGLILEAKDKDEPIESILRVAGAGFPIIENPNLLFHADVYSA